MSAKCADSPPNLTPLNKRHCDKESPLFMSKPFVKMPENNTQTSIVEIKTTLESPYAYLHSQPSIISSDNSDSFSSQSSLQSLSYKSKLEIVNRVIDKQSLRKLPPRPTRMPPPPPTNILPQTQTYKILSRQKPHILIKNELGQQESSMPTENGSETSSTHGEELDSISNLGSQVYQSLSSNYLLPSLYININRLGTQGDHMLPLDTPSTVGPLASSIKVLPSILTMPTLRKTHLSERLGISPSQEDSSVEIQAKVGNQSCITPNGSELEVQSDYSKLPKSNTPQFIIETKPMPDVANSVKMFEALSNTHTYNDICRMKKPSGGNNNNNNAIKSRASFSGFSSKKKHIPNAWRNSEFVNPEQ